MSAGKGSSLTVRAAGFTFTIRQDSKMKSNHVGGHAHRQSLFSSLDSGPGGPGVVSGQP